MVRMSKVITVSDWVEAGNTLEDLRVAHGFLDMRISKLEGVNGD